MTAVCVGGGGEEMANGYVCHILHNTSVVIEWTSLLVCKPV